MENSKLDKRSATFYIKRIDGGRYKLKTLQAIGQEFGVSRERVRQIIDKVSRQLVGKSISYYIINSEYKELIDTLSVDGITIDTNKFISFIDQLTDYFSIEKASMITFSIFNVKNKNVLVRWMINDFYSQKKSYREKIGNEIVPQTYLGKGALFDADLHVYILSFHDLWTKADSY
jgi:hypothetical protein